MWAPVETTWRPQLPSLIWEDYIVRCKGTFASFCFNNMKMDTHTENEEYQNSFPVPLWLLKSFGLVSQIPCRKWFIQTLAFDMEEETGEFLSQLYKSLRVFGSL